MLSRRGGFGVWLPRISMMRRAVHLLVFLGVASLAAGRDVRVTGSELLRPVLEPILAATVLPGDRAIRGELTGSLGGLEALRGGTAELAVLAQPPGQPAPEPGYRLVPLGYQVAVFAVNEANPARQMNFGQLAGIFGENEPTRHRQWGSLGLQGAWAEKSIAPCSVDVRGSLALELFKNTAMQVPQLRGTLEVLPGTAALLKRVQIDDTSIGLFPGPLAETRGLHVLLVARGERDVPFGPTPENVHNGDYPLRLPFVLAFKADQTAELAPLLAVLLGDQVAGALEQHGFMAVPATARSEERRILGLR